MALEIITEDFELFWKRGKDKDYKRADYDELIKSYERQEKYKWHDLRKDPSDLPQNGKDVWVCIGNKKSRTYQKTWHEADGWRHATSKTKRHYEKSSVIAWKYIELFKED